MMLFYVTTKRILSGDKFYPIDFIDNIFLAFLKIHDFCENLREYFSLNPRMASMEKISFLYHVVEWQIQVMRSNLFFNIREV